MNSTMHQPSISTLVERGDEHIARELYGDEAVDTWFREVDGTDPDAGRAEQS